MIIRKITAFERDAVKAFYLALPAEDRRKRFCCTTSDETLSKYVEGLDFMRHTILGAFNEHAELIGVAELAPGANESELAFAVRPDTAALFHAIALAAKGFADQEFKVLPTHSPDALNPCLRIEELAPARSVEERDRCWNQEKAGKQ